MTEPPKADVDGTGDVPIKGAPDFRLPVIRAFTQFTYSMRTLFDLIEHHDTHGDSLNSNAENFKKRVRQWNPVDSDDVIDAIYEAAEQAENENTDREKLPEEVYEAAVAAVFERSDNPRAYAAQYFSDLVGARNRRPRTNLMREALLTSAIAAFEALMANVMLGYAQAKPESMFQSEKTYLLREVAAFDSIEDLVREHAEAFVAKKVFKSVTDWFDWLGRCVDLPLSRITSSEADFQEMFLRRNIIVHAGGIVNDIYLSKLPEACRAPKLNARLSVKSKYLKDACDSLLAAGYACYAHFIAFYEARSESPVEVRGLISMNSFRILIEERPKAVVEYCDSVKHLCDDDEGALRVIQVNQWIARKALGLAAEVREEVKAWDTTDLAKRFQLARLALMDEFPKAFMLADELLKEGDLQLEDWFQWPLLREVRSYAESLPGGYTPRTPELKT